MLSFPEVALQLATSKPILEKFKAEGEFKLTVGDFTSKVAPAFGVKAEATALAKVVDKNAAAFRFIPRRNGSEVVPVAVGFTVFEGADGPVVTTADLQPVEAEFLKHRLGPGGYAIVKIGGVEAKVNIICSDELRNELIVVREDGQTFELVESDGVPSVVIESPLEAGNDIPTMKPMPQRDLPPWADEVPMNVDLEVVEVLEPSRQYKSPRITVTTAAGDRIVGLIATQPIARSITGIREGEVVLTEEVIGQKFQIIDVEERFRADGKPVKGENGEVQKTVIVRNTTKKLEFSL